MPNPFIVLEGLDGVGKSTCVKKLAEKLKGVHIATPMQPFRQLCKEVDDLNDHTTRFFFFLASVIGASASIKALLTQQPVVCDRYIYTTIAYHKAMGVVMDCLDISSLPIVWPSHIFYLTLDESVRYERLWQRGLSHWDKVFMNPKRAQDLRNEFALLRMTTIDTTNKSPDMVVDEMMRYVIGAPSV